MASFTKSEVIKALEATRVVPVFYNPDPETSKNVMKACYEGGVRLFEFTLRGAAAAQVFPQLLEFSKTLPGMILGVGSVSFARDARKFVKMGANFVVGPQYVPGVCRVCNFHRIAYMPGCGTVSEVGNAQRHGCEVCKVFPGDVLGPGFVKALRAPMPWSKIMVTGGVKPEKSNLEAWFKAGTTAVGMGSNLFPKEVVAAGEWDKISALCAETLETVRGLI